MQQPGWYLNRLRVMQPGEILHRTATTLRDLFSLIPVVPDRSARACRDPGPAPAAGETVRFPCDSRTAPRLLREMPHLLPALEAYAEKLCTHRVSFFDLEEADLGPVIDWQRNYHDRRQPPRKQSLFLDYRDPETAGDVKYIWELNRHQHLVPLALAFCLTGKPGLAREIEDQVQTWIDQNPCGRGINWCSALEAGLRLISWSWVFLLLKAAGRDLPPAFFRSVGQHCRFIRDHLSLYSSGGNHLVGEASGLLIAAVLFAREPERSRWTSTARRILLSQIREQVHEDGSHRELSLGYHRFATELFLLPALICRASAADFPAFYWDRLRAMCLYLAEVRDSGGWEPQLGDADSGHCLFFEPPGDGNADSLLSVAAVLFDDAGFLRRVDRPDVKTLLLLGEEAMLKFPGLRARAGELPPQTSRLFPDAGLVVLRCRAGAAGEACLLFDAGPMGMKPMAGHGHADTLGFVLSVGGEPFFVDPGTCTYLTGDPWRTYFRGTSAHNTVRIDRLDQAVAAGPFLWIRHAEAHMMVCDTEGVGPGAKASHDGYGRLREPAIHTREVRFEAEPCGFRIADHIESRGSHLLEFFFHLDPACEVSGDGNKWTIRRGAREVGLELDARLQAAVFRGSEDPVLGWYSPGYGRRQPACTVVGTCRSSGSETFVTRVLLQPRGGRGKSPDPGAA